MGAIIYDIKYNPKLTIMLVLCLYCIDSIFFYITINIFFVAGNMSSAENKTVYSPSICGLCKTKYTRLLSLNDHYNTKNVRRQGKLVPNHCYQANKRFRIKSLDETNKAGNIKKNLIIIFSVFHQKKNSKLDNKKENPL